MASAIKCISCQQRVNAVPAPGQTIVCPMCKTPQRIRDDGQLEPAEMPSLATRPIVNNAGAPPFSSSQPMPPSSLDSASNLDDAGGSGFCLILGCGLGLLLLAAIVGIGVLLMIR